MSGEMNGVARNQWVASDCESEVRIKILAVGCLEEWNQPGAYTSGHAIVYLEFHQVTEDLIRQTGTGVVMSPVLARDFDCIELAIQLHNLGFEGTYRAVAKDFPKPKLIEREVAQMCPRLNFEILLN